MKKQLCRIFKAIFNALATLLGADCEWRRKDVDNGYCDFSGQGSNKYGR